MEVRALIAQLLEMSMDAEVFAVDQYGVTESPVMEIREDARTGRVLLDIEVDEDRTEEPDEERVATRHGEVAEF